MPLDRDDCPRLGDFILQNLEAIVEAWEDFARATWPGQAPAAAELRDNAANMLRAVAADLKLAQSIGEQKLRSAGEGWDHPSLAGAALQHAKERLSAGFDIVKLVAEFRALRASVIRMWQAGQPTPYPKWSEDLVRFNEAIDQLVATSVEAHSARVEQGRRLFLGIIGHDLRQPLCSVRLLASALARTGTGGDLSAIVTKIQSGVDAIDGLVRDLLDLSGTELGKPLTLYSAKVDLGELAREAVARVEAAHPEIAFELACEGDLSGEWDGYRLKQLFAQLLGNAARHGTEGTVVELAVRSSGESVGITVRSSGQQVPEQLFNLLFEPLPRHSLTESIGDAGSMGLGLYVCREIVRAHRGTIEVITSDEGATTFTITLPRIWRDGGEPA